MDQLTRMLSQVVGKKETAYIEDVFSTYLYTGTGSTQTITNGIDLSGKGGLVWTKRRDAAFSNELFDTARGNFGLESNNTGGQWSAGAGAFTTSATGYTWGIVDSALNANGGTYASWTFRKQAKFFDVVTWTGNSSGIRQIPHSLGVAPGFIVFKMVNADSFWYCWHRSQKDAASFLNSFDTVVDGSTYFGNGSAVIQPTASEFTVGSSYNLNGITYVAYLFAHNTSSDGFIQCGSVTTDGSGISSLQNLGWEPQWVMTKGVMYANANDQWLICDSMRGINKTSNPYLSPNNSAAENFFGTPGPWINPDARGFNIQGLNPNSTYMYIAIRRGPMKTPTTGTSVFYPGSGYGPTDLGQNFDMAMGASRSGTYGFQVIDRLRGLKIYTAFPTSPELMTYSTSAEVTNNPYPTGLASASGGYVITAPSNIGYIFRRAPGFFDEVCYTGTGSNTTQTHNLSVVPEMIIIAARNGTPSRRWSVGHKINSFAGGCELNTNGAMDNNNFTYFASTAPTASVFSLPNIVTNDSGVNYVAYLFASLPGISKVGSYTGNGSSQTINCGFTTGARFILIKRTDSSGDWYVWDSARGIISANDPHLSLNTTVAEVTDNDSIDPDSTGFSINQSSATNINVNTATYIFLAIA